MLILALFFFSSRRRHTRYIGDWSSDVCSSDLCPFDREAVSRDGDPVRRRGGSQYGKPRARSWFLRISRAARKRWAVAQRPVGTRHSIASRSESAFVTWLGANQSLRAPIRGGAITRLPKFARNSTVAQNIARMRHGARLLSSPKPGPM